MSNAKLCLLGVAVVSVLVFAQEAPDYDGRWRGTFLNPSGIELDVELILAGSSGTWKIFPRGKQAQLNPCLGRAHPVTVHKRSPSELKFSIDASKSIPGCDDGHAAVKLIDHEHLAGHFGDGRTLNLARK